MAKRHRNNPRVTNRGYVEDHHCLDIRKLAAKGLLAKGERTTWTEHGPWRWTITADLEVASQAFIEIQHLGSVQKVAITWKSNRANRARLFFVDDTGRKSEKLYCVDDRFVSRQIGRLTFRSQSCGKEDRISALQEPIRKRLGAEAVKNKLPPEKRSRLEERLNDLDRAKELVDFDFWQSKWERSEDRRAQRRLMLERLKRAKKAVRRRRHVSGNYIIARHAGLVDGLKSRSPRSEKQDPWAVFNCSLQPLPIANSEAVLDLDLLRRMKLLRKGEITAVELGWPIKWLPQRRRQIRVLFDLREPSSACAVVIFQTAKRTVPQFFWIASGGRRFGAEIYAFENPDNGRSSLILAYRGGRFELAERPTPPTLYSLLRRLRVLRLEMWLSGRRELAPEHVAILKQLGKMPEFQSMHDDRMRDLTKLAEEIMGPGPILDRNGRNSGPEVIGTRNLSKTMFSGGPESDLRYASNEALLLKF